MRWLGLLLLIASLVLPRPAGAGERTVDLALVLLTDVSRSVDQREYALMKEGYAAEAKDDMRAAEAAILQSRTAMRDLMTAWEALARAGIGLPVFAPWEKHDHA